MIDKFLKLSLISIIISSYIYGDSRMIIPEKVNNSNDLPRHQIKTHKVNSKSGNIKSQRIVGHDIEKIVQMYPQEMQNNIRNRIKNTPPQFLEHELQIIEREARKYKNIPKPPKNINSNNKHFKRIEPRKKINNSNKLQIEENKKDFIYHNKVSQKNIKKSTKNEDKVDKLLMVIEMMNEEEKKIKQQEIEKKKKMSETDIEFTPLKSIRVGGRIYVDVEISFIKTKFINKVIETFAPKSKTPTPPPKPGSKPVKPKKIKKTVQEKQEKVIPAKVYTLTVGDQIEDWKVIKATDRYIVFKNVKNDKTIKKYY